MNNQIIHELDAAIEHNPEDAKAYSTRGDAYLRKGEYDRAIKDYNAAIKLAPENSEVYVDRGCAYFNKGDCDRAIADYDKAIQLNSEEVDAYMGKEQAYKEKCDDARAFATKIELLRLMSNLELAPLDAAIKAAPQDAEAYYNRALFHDERGDYDFAISDYSEAIRLAPKYAEAYHGRGTAYYYKSHEEEDRAIADYNKAIQFYDAYSSGRAEVIRARGLIYENKETIDGYSKAIADYEWAARDGLIHYYNLVLDVYFKRAKLYAENGDYDSAIADMSSIIELDDYISTDYDEGFRRGPEYDPDSYPSNYGSVPAGQAYNDRAFYYSKKGEYDRAIADFTEAFRIYNERVELIPESNPDFAIIYLNLGSVYQAKMDYDMAIENYDNVVRICPNYVEDFVNSKFAHGGQKEVDKAIKLLKRVVNNTTHSESFAAYCSGLSILFSDNRHKARRRFETARKLGFDDDTKITEHFENLKKRK